MNHSKKRSSLQEQERHDGMIQRRTTVSRDELPVVPMFPSAVESLGCEGDGMQDAGDAQPTSGAKRLQPSTGEGGGHAEERPHPARVEIRVPVFTKEWCLEGLAAPEPSPTPADPEKTAPEPDPGPRFGIRNDGVLALRVRAGFIELEADEFDALVNFLDRIRAGGVS